MGLSCLARSGLPALVPQKRNSVDVMFWPYNKSFIDQACSVKMVGYWPRSFLRLYGPRLLTSRLVNNAYNLSILFVRQLNWSILSPLGHLKFDSKNSILMT